MAASEIEDVRARGSRQGTGGTGLNESYYKIVFRGDEVVEYSELKKVKLTFKETLR